jgi:hypothetical protein
MLSYMAVQNFMIAVEGVIACGPLYVTLPHCDININGVVLFVVRCEVLMGLIFISIRHKTWHLSLLGFDIYRVI